ncbi:MAG: polysaccharide deacetylase family protein [Gammaproteobacteria bacterium]|nr:polysaccharide deacetylase family protein [Gammaproteobacteria bacterium]
MNSRIKRKVSEVAQRLCFSLNLSPMMAKRANVARVLMFHGIGNGEHSAELLENKIRFLKQHFNIVSLEHLLTKISAGTALSNEVVLTFDDGLRNNAVHAYPILKKFDTPATFFVCPGLIESGSWLWNHEARERLRSLPTEQRKELATAWGCNDDLEAIITWLKELDIQARREKEEAIRELTHSFTPSADQKNAYDMMSWDDLRGLDENLITIGSHTTNHAITKDLNDTALDVEIVESRMILEQQLSRSINHFCYPNGYFDQTTIEAVKSTYKSAVTTDEGTVNLADDLYLLSRIPSESSLPCFAWRLVRPMS